MKLISIEPTIRGTVSITFHNEKSDKSRSIEIGGPKNERLPVTLAGYTFLPMRIYPGKRKHSGYFIDGYRNFYGDIERIRVFVSDDGEKIIHIKQETTEQKSSYSSILHIPDEEDLPY